MWLTEQLWTDAVLFTLSLASFSRILAAGLATGLKCSLGKPKWLGASPGLGKRGRTVGINENMVLSTSGEEMGILRYKERFVHCIYEPLCLKQSVSINRVYNRRVLGGNKKHPAPVDLGEEGSCKTEDYSKGSPLYPAPLTMTNHWLVTGTKSTLHPHTGVSEVRIWRSEVECP